MIQYIFCTHQESMAEVWNVEFNNVENVEIYFGDIFSVSCDALVSPANSKGWMDGGLDREINRFFKGDIEEKVMALIETEHNGSLPVGLAEIIETDDDRISYLVVAPTMEMPGAVADTGNAYLAMRATLRAVESFERKHPGTISCVAIPAFCAGVGMMPLATVAWQMKRGWDEVQQLAMD